MYITIAGYKHYFGLLPFSVGKLVTLVREVENAYDKNAIAVYQENYGKVGYVAATTETAAYGTEVAEQVLPHIGDGICAAIRFIAGEYVIAELIF
ncbi:MAG: HIRAN domain-containing protein [Clostridia bacterium]|nr:HIRAN domain-containing protein [Clostridia bacterium]